MMRFSCREHAMALLVGVGAMVCCAPFASGCGDKSANVSGNPGRPPTPLASAPVVAARPGVASTPVPPDVARYQQLLQQSHTAPGQR